MKKKNFVSMILSAAGGILFAMGMCMCLLPEWNVFNPGVAMGAVGAKWRESLQFIFPAGH